MTVKIGLNLQPLADSHLTGIGVYTKEIASRLPSLLAKTGETEGHVFDFLGRNKVTEDIERYLPDAKRTVGDPRLTVLTCRKMPLGAYIRLGRIARLVPYQKLLGAFSEITVFFNYLCPAAVLGKTVITVYDMVVKRFPETMDARNRRLLERHLEASCRRADRIITISDFSKSEIAELFSIAPEKILVAKCGYDRRMFHPAADERERLTASAYLGQKYHIRSRYVLYLGTLEPRKNLETLLTAFPAVREKYPDIKLVISGGNGWQSEETRKRLESAEFKDMVIRTGYVPEEDKRLLYLCAEMLVFPSLYEGFGLPVLEAMACGTPVIGSNTSSIPEVLGEAGILVDALRPEGFTEAMLTVLSDRRLAARMGENGRNRADLFSWDDAANVYADCISDLKGSMTPVPDHSAVENARSGEAESGI